MAFQRILDFFRARRSRGLPAQAVKIHAQLHKTPEGGSWHNFGAYGQEVEVACFSADGNRLLTVHDVGVAQIWQVETGQLVGELRPKSPLEGGAAAPTTEPFQVFIESACLSPDGQSALLGLNDGRAQLLRVADGACLATLAPPDVGEHWRLVRAVSWSLDGRLVAVGFWNRRWGSGTRWGGPCTSSSTRRHHARSTWTGSAI